MSLLRRAYGPTVRAIREAFGLGLVDVATRAGLSKGYMANFEAGRRRLTDEPTQTMARVLGVEPEVITGQKPAIATIRAALGIDQVAFARDVGLSHGQLDRIERGVDLPADETVRIMATRLGVSPLALQAHQANAMASGGGRPRRSA